MSPPSSHYQTKWIDAYRQLSGGVLPVDGCDLPGGGGIIGIDGQIPADLAPVIAYAQAPHLGKPYVWGGSGPDVFDCSGLTLRAYQTIGINLPHKSAAQARYVRAVDWRTEPIRTGDLIFHRGSIPVHDNGHVGFAISTTYRIVAPKSGDVVSLRPIPFDRFKPSDTSSNPRSDHAQNKKHRCRANRTADPQRSSRRCDGRNRSFDAL